MFKITIKLRVFEKLYLDTQKLRKITRKPESALKWNLAHQACRKLAQRHHMIGVGAKDCIIFARRVFGIDITAFVEPKRNHTRSLIRVSVKVSATVL